MNKNSTLYRVINEMMSYAAMEINYPHSDGNIEYLIICMKHNYDIPLNFNGPITTQLMRLICDEIEEWKTSTKYIGT